MKTRFSKESHTDKNIKIADFSSSSDIMAEAFRMLRLHVDCLLDNAKNQELGISMLVTSAIQNEGKTTVASNLAVACANSGIETLLIDGDTRNPFVHKSFKCIRIPGLSDALLDDQMLTPNIQATDQEHLSLLTSGRSVSQSSELLSSVSFSGMLNHLRKKFQLIIVDSPPIGLVADAGIIATKVQHVYLVVRSGKTNRRTIEKAAQTIIKLGAELTGVVMTRCDIRKDRYHYYAAYPGYYSRYYHEDARPE